MKINFERNETFMHKKRKEKIILTISIGLTAFILCMIMFAQFKTVQETDITGIETMREAELRTELASWKSQYEDTISKTEETENKIEEYTKQLEENNDLTELLTEELEEAKMYAGYTNLTGEGIIITLKDTETSQIVASDLIDLVNELKASGAEAISVNEERIVTVTDFYDIDYRYILINSISKSTKISSPYTVKAIGNQKYLESAISIKNGYIDQMKASGKSVSYELSSNVFVEKYDGSLDYKYATD